MLITDLRTDARYLISPSLTATGYPDAALDRNMNRWYRTLLGWAIAAQGEWETSGSIIYRDFLAGVTQYQIPSNLLRIYKAEAMYATGGAFVPITAISVQQEQDVAEGNTTRPSDDVTHPTMEVFGQFLEVRPAPVADVVNGLKIWIQKDLLDIDATVNKLPDLLEPVVRGLSTGAAYDFAVSKEMWQKAGELKRILYGDPRVKDDEDSIKKMVENLYAMRTGNRRDRLTARRSSFR